MRVLRADFAYPYMLLTVELLRVYSQLESRLGTFRQS
jgi:hypothetical protein